MIAIDEISGICDHSDDCAAQIEMERDPRLPLHSELREYALSLLRKNVPLSLLRSECSAWAQRQWPGLSGNNSSRYCLTTHDVSSLYRTISRERGIPQRTAAEDNLDKWFRPDKAQPPSPLLTQSCLHYLAHKEAETDRFEIILSTPEMQTAAWKFGHEKQVVMDLTFGVCSARALLVILMAIDDSGSGIPICFMLFTARESAKAAHADYDTAVLHRLLGLFKNGMGTNELGEQFNIKIATTDNDTRERTALTNNWDGIFLLLCIFHVWQAWRNGLNRYLRGIPKGETRQSVRQQLGKLLMKILKDITIYDDAISLYNTEIQYWKLMLRKKDKLSQSQAKGALAFLQYLDSYLANHAFWQSWSPAGAVLASQRLGIPISQIARTNNHLESFNGRIKGKYCKPYQHSGCLPHIDIWILLLVTVVMPDFFKECHEKQVLSDHYAALCHITAKPNTSPCTKHKPPLALSGFTSSDGETIQTWLTDLLNDDENGLEQVGDTKEQDKPTEGCSLFVPEDSESDPEDLHHSAEKDILPSDAQAFEPHVSTSVDFSEDRIVGENNEHVNLFATKVRLTDSSVSKRSLPGAGFLRYLNCPRFVYTN